MKINDLIADIFGSAKMARQSRSEPQGGKIPGKSAEFASVLKDEIRMNKGGTEGGEFLQMKSSRSFLTDHVSGRLDEDSLDDLAGKLAKQADWLPREGIFPGVSGKTGSAESEGLPELDPAEKVKGLLRLWKDIHKDFTPPGGHESGGKTGGTSPEDLAAGKSREHFASAALDFFEAAAAAVPADKGCGGNSLLAGSLQEDGMKGAAGKGFPESSGGLSPEPYIEGSGTVEAGGAKAAKRAYARAEILRRFQGLMREHSVEAEDAGQPQEPEGRVPAFGHRGDSGSGVQASSFVKPEGTPEGAQATETPEGGLKSPKGQPFDTASFEGRTLQAGQKGQPRTEGLFEGASGIPDKTLHARDGERTGASQAATGETVATADLAAPAREPADVDRAAVMSRGMARVIEVIKDRDGHKGRMLLDPPELGAVRIELQSSQDQVRLHLVVESAQAREMVDQSLDLLRQSLARQGLTLAETTVDVGGDGSGNQAAWEAGQAQGSVVGGPGMEGDEAHVPEEVVARLDIEKGLLNWIA